jgi:hypothetical protein
MTPLALKLLKGQSQPQEPTCLWQELLLPLQDSPLSNFGSQLELSLLL